MSAYYTRYCEKHGEWDNDVDKPDEGCPGCVADGKFKTRDELERALAAANADTALLDWIDAQLIDGFHVETVGGEYNMRRVVTVFGRDGGKSVEAHSIREAIRAAQDAARKP